MACQRFESAFLQERVAHELGFAAAPGASRPMLTWVATRANGAIRRRADSAAQSDVLHHVNISTAAPAIKGEPPQQYADRPYTFPLWEFPLKSHFADAERAYPKAANFGFSCAANHSVDH